MIALVVAVAPCVPGFLHTVGAVKGVPEFWVHIYTYAWFATFIIAFGLYGLMMIGHRSIQET